MTNKEILVGSYIRDLLNDIAEARLKFIREMVEYISQEFDDFNSLLRKLMSFCNDRLKELRKLESIFSDTSIFQKCGLFELNLQKYCLDELAFVAAFCKRKIQGVLSPTRPLSLHIVNESFLLPLETGVTGAESRVSETARRLRANSLCESHPESAMSIPPLLRLPAHLYFPIPNFCRVSSLIDSPLERTASVGSRTSRRSSLRAHATGFSTADRSPKSAESRSTDTSTGAANANEVVSSLSEPGIIIEAQIESIDSISHAESAVAAFKSVVPASAQFDS